MRSFIRRFLQATDPHSIKTVSTAPFVNDSGSAWTKTPSEGSSSRMTSTESGTFTGSYESQQGNTKTDLVTPDSKLMASNEDQHQKSSPKKDSTKPQTRNGESNHRGKDVVVVIAARVDWAFDSVIGADRDCEFDAVGCGDDGDKGKGLMLCDFLPMVSVSC